MIGQELASRFVNRPVALERARAEMMLPEMASRFGFGRVRIVDANGERDITLAPRPSTGPIDAIQKSTEAKPYDVVDGIAIIPIAGTLVAKLGAFSRYFWGITGYDGIRYQMLAAAADPDVRAIALDVDSPGGEVAGCLDLVDEIYALRAAKPIWAVCTEMACSAAYAIASAADKIIVPRTGMVGSIGVITMHVDCGRMLDEAGLTVTLIHAGKHKADANPFGPLPDDVRADIQRDIDAVGGLFRRTVARNRGLDEAAVQATEARTYLADEAVRLGLADEVLSETQAWLALQREFGATTRGA